MMSFRRRGFTLMEMLLVTVLVAVISMAVFNAFSNGLRLWARGARVDNQADVALLLEKMGDDLRSTTPLSAFSFSGTGMRLSFPAVIWTTADPRGSRAGEGMVDQIGMVEYRFEAGEGKIFRRQANYAQALKRQWGPAQEVASGLEEVIFRYYFAGPKGYVTLMSADSGGIPAGVFIEAQVKGRGWDSRLQRFFAIPSGEQP